MVMGTLVVRTAAKFVITTPLLVTESFLRFACAGLPRKLRLRVAAVLASFAHGQTKEDIFGPFWYS